MVVTGTVKNISESYVEWDPTRFEQNLNSIYDLISQREFEKPSLPQVEHI
jgi:hypothetical protein